MNYCVRNETPEDRIGFKQIFHLEDNELVIMDFCVSENEVTDYVIITDKKNISLLYETLKEWCENAEKR